LSAQNAIARHSERSQRKCLRGVYRENGENCKPRGTSRCREKARNGEKQKATRTAIMLAFFCSAVNSSFQN